MKKQEPMREIPRAQVEQVAKIVGPSSASAQALKDADAHDGPVRFFKSGSSILLEKLAKEMP